MFPHIFNNFSFEFIKIKNRELDSYCYMRSSKLPVIQIRKAHENHRERFQLVFWITCMKFSRFHIAKSKQKRFYVVLKIILSLNYNFSIFSFLLFYVSIRFIGTKVGKLYHTTKFSLAKVAKSQRLTSKDNKSTRLRDNKICGLCVFARDY